MQNATYLLSSLIMILTLLLSGSMMIGNGSMAITMNRVHITLHEFVELVAQLKPL